MQGKEWSLKKKIIVGIFSTILVFALVIGVVYIAVYSNRGTVLVVPVSDVVYGDNNSDDYGIQGTISTGKVQNIRKDEGKVSKIYVSEGDSVKKGAVLVQFETTMEDLELKQAQINLESRKLDLSRAQKKLEMLNAAKPYEAPEDDDDEDEAKDEDWDEDETEDEDWDEDEEDEDSDSDDKDSDKDEKEKVVVNLSGEPLFELSSGEVITETELRRGKNDATAAIASANTEIKACTEKIETAQKALSKRRVTAEFDGYVTKVNSDSEKKKEDTEEESDEFSSETVTDSNQESILIQVSSQEGLFVKSYMNEWRKEQLQIGDTVYLMNWQNGETYEAAITSVSDQVSESATNMYSDRYGDSASYFPFTAEVKGEDVPLSAGDSVDVYFKNPKGMYSDGPVESSDGKLNVMKAFIRTENGRKYVYVRGENDLLQKRYIKTDGQTQGCYIVTEGLTTEDFIAFPYGKDVRNGAKVREGSIGELYGY